MVMDVYPNTPVSLHLSPQSHRRQHNKDKPYKCHNCNRGYTDAASLEVHLSTHTVKHAKLFSCGLCNRSYTSVSSQDLVFTHDFGLTVTMKLYNAKVLYLLISYIIILLSMIFSIFGFMITSFDLILSVLYLEFLKYQNLMSSSWSCCRVSWLTFGICHQTS